MNTAPYLQESARLDQRNAKDRARKEVLNQQDKDSQGLIKEIKEMKGIEKEENNKQGLRMPSPEEMKERKKKSRV